MIADDVIADMTMHPRLKAAIEELQATMEAAGAGHAAVRLVCDWDVGWKTVPVTFSITVGDEDEE